MFNCSHCNTPVPTGARFCLNCGMQCEQSTSMQLPGVPENKSQSDQPDKSVVSQPKATQNMKPLFLILGGIIGIVLVFFLINIANPNNSIYGKWYSPDGICVEFQSDGTSTVSLPDHNGNLSVNPPDTAHFTVEGNIITQEGSSTIKRYSYEIISGQLILRDAYTSRILGIFTRTSPSRGSE